MEDEQIVELYWERSQQAISATSKRYGRYLHSIALNILRNRQDADECINEAYLRAWQSIPPNRPQRLALYLGKIVRNLALNMYAGSVAQKRGGGQLPLVLDELTCSIPTVGDVADDLILIEILNRFLASLPAETRRVFMGRYWHFRSLQELAVDYGWGLSKVKMTLLRARNELKRLLETEGIEI